MIVVNMIDLRNMVAKVGNAKQAKRVWQTTKFVSQDKIEARIVSAKVISQTNPTTSLTTFSNMPICIFGPY